MRFGSERVAWKTPTRLPEPGAIRPVALLFLLGLVSGLVTGAMTNPRMGLSAHLEGVMNGTFLLAVGAIWRHVSLSLRLQSVTFWAFAYGTVVNWMSIQLAAFWGTGRMTPLAAPGREAAGWQEAIVAFGLISLTVAMLVGLMRPAPSS